MKSWFGHPLDYELRRQKEIENTRRSFMLETPDGREHLGHQPRPSGHGPLTPPHQGSGGHKR